jgi:hypothetical protein
MKGFLKTGDGFLQATNLLVGQPQVVEGIYSLGGKGDGLPVTLNG